MFWVYRMLLGEITLLFYGNSPERILNICARNRLFLRHTTVGKDGVTGRLFIKNFRKLRPLLRKTGIKIKIIKKQGFPFFADKYKARIGFLAGFFVFCLILKLMSGYIWNVNVYGNEKVSSESIILAAQKVGVFEGVNKKSIKTTADAQKMLISMPELAWASFNIENCILTINVTETKKTDKDKSLIPTNLKAKCDGIISEIDVTAGNVLVKIGDVVSKGDILVSGVGQDMGVSVFEHSRGTVKAKTEKTFYVEGEYSYTEKIKTGKSDNKFVLTFFNIDIPLYIGETKQTYLGKKSVNDVTIFGNAVPIKITKKHIDFIKVKNKTYSRDELYDKLKKEIIKKTQKEGLENCKLKHEEIIEKDEKIILKQTFSANEIISIEDLILFDTIN